MLRRAECEASWYLKSRGPAPANELEPGLPATAEKPGLEILGYGV